MYPILDDERTQVVIIGTATPICAVSYKSYATRLKKGKSSYLSDALAPKVESEPYWLQTQKSKRLQPKR